MEMRMPDGLAGRRSNIETDVDPALGLRSSEISLDPTSQIEDSCLLLQRKREEICLVASGDDERVARRYRIGILKRYGQSRGVVVMA